MQRSGDVHTSSQRNVPTKKVVSLETHASLFGEHGSRLYPCSRTIRYEIAPKAAVSRMFLQIQGIETKRTAVGTVIVTTIEMSGNTTTAVYHGSWQPAHIESKSTAVGTDVVTTFEMGGTTTTVPLPPPWYTAHLESGVYCCMQQQTRVLHPVQRLVCDVCAWLFKLPSQHKW